MTTEHVNKEFDDVSMTTEHDDIEEYHFSMTTVVVVVALSMEVFLADC